MSQQDMSEVNRLSSESDLQAIATVVWQAAQQRRGDGLALLSLLRQLETLHQRIRDELFQECLPDNRQALYSMLKDMEAEGGWPYIHRMKLQWLMSNLATELVDGEDSATHENPVNR
jgi:hypothetical protein